MAARGEAVPQVVRRLRRLDVIVAQYIHLVGAGLAAGTNLFLLFPAQITFNHTLDTATADKAAAEMMTWVRIVFWIAIVFLSVGGLYLTTVGSGITSLRQLLGTTYGRVLAVKISLALVASTIVLVVTIATFYVSPIYRNDVLYGLLIAGFLTTGTAVLLGAVLRRF
jgi:hypothetical protein